MEGQTPSDLYFIISGEVKTYKVNYDGKELITGIHSGGDFLGYVPLLEERQHNESAEVLEESEISIIPKQDFLDPDLFQQGHGPEVHQDAVEQPDRSRKPAA